MAGELPLTRRKIDRHVGLQIQRRRAARGISPERLGADIGVSATEIKHYETGRVRVPAAHLWDIANALGAPISYFFSDSRTDPID